MSVPPRSAVRAAFDVPLDPRDRARRIRGVFRTAPVEVIVARRPAEVPTALARAHAAARAGRWVVGGLAYEAGAAWEPAARFAGAYDPLAWFEVHDGEPEPWPKPDAGVQGADAEAPDWFVSGGFRGHTPAGAIGQVRARIAAGDYYQVNLTSRLTASARGSLWDLTQRLARSQPGGYTVFLREPGVASVSPELFFHLHPDGRLVTHPMKGTAPPDALDRLGTPKERAENVMIVDLLRNDLSRVCLPGTVRVDGLFELVRLPTLWQMVSTVSGRVASGVGLADVCAALFPCGSVTGAPKLAAMAAIAALEQGPRGWYCGTLAVMRPGGEVIANVAIRTVEGSGAWWRCGVGSGIVADSRPLDELAEWRLKSRFLGGRPQRALETMLLADGAYLLGERHLERLGRCEAELGLGVPLDEVGARLDAVAAAQPVGAHRVRVVAGDGAVEVRVARLPDTPRPVRLAVAAEALDVAVLGPVVIHKTTYRHHYERLRALAPPGVFDVICHTAEGQLTEGTLGNLAFELDGRWVTPHESVGLLPGTRRAELLARGALVEAPVRLTDLARVTAVAFLNGTRGWCPAVLV